MHLCVLASCAVLLSTLNLLVTVDFDNLGGDKLHSYSYIGDDYPAEWSIKDTQHVISTVEDQETVHYQIDRLDAREQ
ncbi:hypothetical protein A0H81_06182 [Grifola frondosa]|uniref:Uncharacterized protein n=1 Tax=Grifola frondosa TaxID=5627 RepID=A0A1C7MCW7_GRIFR|nr:hypothetical protein A0H81_06182 [Grifola frondosa]